MSLSERQSVDRDTADSGCNGALMDYASAFAEKNVTRIEGSCPSSTTEQRCLHPLTGRRMEWVGALEGAWVLSTDNIVSLGGQQLEDCDKTDSGCNGGLMPAALRSWRRMPSALSEVILARRKTKPATCLKSALMLQPVSIAIEADQSLRCDELQLDVAGSECQW